MQIRVIAAGALLTVAIAACQNTRTEHETDEIRRPAATETSPKVSGPSLRYRTVSYGTRGVTVPVPSRGYEIRHRTFTGSASTAKIAETLSIRRGGLLTVVAADLWINPERKSLSAWFDRHLAYLVRYGGLMEKTRGTAHNIPIWLVHHDHSPQAPARITASFVLSGYAFRVTCFDAGDREALEIFRRVLAQFAVAEVRP